ncbi:MAG: response regulator [Rikenellaceae bacterium]
MIVFILTSLSVLLFLVCLYFAYNLYYGKTCAMQEHGYCRGSFMTIVYNKDLYIKKIVNPQSEILLSYNTTSLIGLNVRDLVGKASSDDLESAIAITSHVIEASETKENVFFEYADTDIKGMSIRVLCYVEYQADGSLFSHAVRVDTEKRIKGCGRCPDYPLAIGMNNVTVGVYVRRLGLDDHIVFFNDCAKKYCGCDDLTYSKCWDQEAEDIYDQRVLNGESPVSYEKILYSEEGEPIKWFNVSKVKQDLEQKGLYIITTIVETTEVKKKEKELEDIKINLGLAISAGDVSVWRYSVKEGRFFAVYGEVYAPNTDFDTCAQSMLPESRELLYKTFDKLLTQKSTLEKGIFNILNPATGRYHFIQSEMMPVLSAHGEVEYIIGTHKDVTQDHLRELELKDMRKNLDLAIEASGILAWEFDAKTEKIKILYGSNIEPEVEHKINTFSKEELLKNTIYQKDIDRYAHFINDLKKKGGRDTIILKGAALSIAECEYYEVIVSAIKNENGEVVKLLGSRRNITKSYRQKIELEKTQEYLSLALDAGGVAVWIYNIEKKMFFTLQGNTIAGTGLSIEDNAKMMHPDDAVTCQNIMESMSCGEVSNISVIYRYKADDVDGGYRYYEARKIAVYEDGVLTYITGTQKDVTKEQFHQKELEESNLRTQKALNELQQTSTYNQLILDNTDTGLAYVSPDFVVLWENISLMAGSERYNVYKKGEICYKAINPDLNSPCPGCPVIEAVKAKQRVSKEITLSYGDIIDVTATPVYKESKELDGVVFKIENVTKERRSFKELQEAKEKAERSDRFKTNFLANMSHEIRTPLNAIVGFSDLIANVDSKDEQKEYSRIISTNNELLLKLISDILDLSKIEAGFMDIKNDYFDLSGLFTELLMLFETKMESDVKLVYESQYKSCMVCLDKSRITQIVSNFVTNAAKFTTHGYIKIGYEVIDGGVRIYVSDTGIGIAKENISSVFERFEKLNDFAQGTGLGLSICKSIVDAYKGKIGVNSKEGEGSTFWVEVPCEFVVDDKKSQPIGHELLKEADHSNVNNGRKRILVAEDADSNYILISSMLKKEYDLTRALNGERAVYEVMTNQYDIVLMDVKMPVMDGLQATRKIREFNETITIIVVTANAFDSDKESALKAGANDFVAKPINRLRLLDMLSKY